MAEAEFDVIIVGAGFGGIGAAIAFQRLGYRRVLIVDREDDLGGTWYVNHYPGLTVDVPSPTYSYWFEPNPHWSRLYAPRDELKDYADLVVDKYDVRRYMRFNTTVDGAHWDGDAQVWMVAVRGGERLSARFLVAATGLLCQPCTPDITGIETFQGRLLHTADWDDGYSFAGRRVAVIGTGSTAVQVIPELAGRTAELTVYQRTPIWVMPKIDIAFPPAVRQMFSRVPATQRILRWFTDTVMNVVMVLAMWRFRHFKGLNVAAANISRLLRFVSIRDPVLRRKLDPDYDFGCKRPTLSNTYYRALAKPHVVLETSGIARIEPDGIVAGDGTKRYVDAVVLATGFDVWEANMPAIEVIGRNGRNLGKWWRENRFQAYEGLTVPGFPNFLSLASPYAWVGLSWFNTVEYQMRHVERLVAEVQRRHATTFEVTAQANEGFLEKMTDLLEDSVFALGNCATSRSYWFDRSGEAPLFRPTSVGNAVRRQNRFPLTDYTIA